MKLKLLSIIAILALLISGCGKTTLEETINHRENLEKIAANMAKTELFVASTSNSSSSAKSVIKSTYETIEDPRYPSADGWSVTKYVNDQNLDVAAQTTISAARYFDYAGNVVASRSEAEIPGKIEYAMHLEYQDGSIMEMYETYNATDDKDNYEESDKINGENVTKNCNTKTSHGYIKITEAEQTIHYSDLVVIDNWYTALTTTEYIHNKHMMFNSNLEVDIYTGTWEYELEYSDIDYRGSQDHKRDQTKFKNKAKLKYNGKNIGEIKYKDGTMKSYEIIIY